VFAPINPDQFVKSVLCHRRSWRKLDGILLTALEGLAGVAALAFFYLGPRERGYFGASA
jgi:hypothetical protein